MGGEFTTLKPFLHSIGVTIKHSCPYTHRQNGLVERKHQHITEIGLSLLAQASLPFQFWWDAFSTAILLINSLPSPTLRNSSPYHLLFKRLPDYSFFKVFGCSCFPFLRPYTIAKLQYRSSKYLFLGYSDSYKGYKYLHSSSRIYISKTIEFNELEFSFHLYFHLLSTQPFFSSDIHSSCSSHHTSTSLFI